MRYLIILVIFSCGVVYGGEDIVERFDRKWDEILILDSHGDRFNDNEYPTRLDVELDMMEKSERLDAMEREYSERLEELEDRIEELDGE